MVDKYLHRWPTITDIPRRQYQLPFLFTLAFLVPARYLINLTQPWSFIELFRHQIWGGLKGTAPNLGMSSKILLLYLNRPLETRRSWSWPNWLPGGNNIWRDHWTPAAVEALEHPPPSSGSGWQWWTRGGERCEWRSKGRKESPPVQGASAADLAADGATEWGQTPGLALELLSSKEPTPCEENELKRGST